MSDTQLQTKKCTSCGCDKPVAEFHHSKATRDGYTQRCKACRKIEYESKKGLVQEYYKKNRAKLIEQAREYSRLRKRKKRNAVSKKKHNEQNKEYRKRYPVKSKAQDAVSYAIAQGRFPRASTHNCTHCGSAATEYHHWSYEPEHWLDVIPLCHNCHMKIHSPSKK